MNLTFIQTLSSQAFKDLDGLIEKVGWATSLCFILLRATIWQAKDMVSLVNKFAAKLEDKKGSLTEDEVSSLV